MKVRIECDVDCEGFSQLERLRAVLEGAQRVALLAHMNADGDAVGSLTGLADVLRRMTGAAVTPMLPDGCPSDLAWMPGADLVLNGQTQAEACRSALAEADVVIGTDFNSPTRVGSLEEPLRQSRATKVVIDHHHDPETAAFDMVFSAPSMSSACELVYWTVRGLWGPACVGRDAATSLYAGLRTDTGGMAYSNTETSLYLAAAELIATGIDPMAINRDINNTFSPERMRFYGFALSQRLDIDAARGTALMTIAQSDMRAFGVSSADLTGLVNEVMRVRCVECAVLVREEEGRVRLSLRSKDRTDVHRMAAELFGGGGHTRAAGATSHLPLDETVRLVREKLNMQPR